MKKIGLVGGTGPESTLMYYRELNTRIDRMTGGKQMPEIVIESVDFRRAWEYVSSGRYDLLADYLTEKVNRLKRSGAEVISLTAATMHVVYDEITERTRVPMVSIPRVVCEEVKRRQYRRIGLLGTIFTMEKDYMKKDFLEAGIEVCIPDPADRILIARRIFEELEFGIVKESTLREFQWIIQKMIDSQGIEAVVLGCTELPLILHTDNCPVPCLDSVEIHINELIKRVMTEERKEANRPDPGLSEIVIAGQKIPVDGEEHVAYRRTTHSSDSFGVETRKDFFYDSHDNPVCLVETSQLERNPNTPSGLVIRRKYKYNEDGTIAEQTTSGDNPFGTVTTSRFTYNSRKKVSLEHRFEDSMETGVLSYDYDSHDNPIRVTLSTGDNVIRTTQGIKYTYDVNGRVAYKQMLYHSGDGAMITIQTWYEYDEQGRVVIEKNLRAGAEVPEWRKNFYDGNDRLIKSTRYQGDDLLANEIYEYEFYQ